MICDVSFVTNYKKKECPESNECIFWGKDGCILRY